MLGKRYKNDGASLIPLSKLQTSYVTAVKQKVIDGVYKMESVSCAVCDQASFELLSEKDRYGFSCNFAICKNCGLVQTNPRMDQAAYNEFYDKEYRYIYGDEEGPTENFFWDQYHRLGKKIYEFILIEARRTSLKDKFVLEIGCGAGGILKYFKDQGCLIKGIDLGSAFVQYGKEKHSLDLQVSTIENLKLERRPDVIIYSHVLEHILNLNSQLQHIRELMHDETILYVEVPGLKYLDKSYQNDLLLYLQNAHVYHFTKTSLINLMKKNGFMTVTANEFVRAIFRKSAAVEKTEISNEYPRIVRYLRRIEWLRKTFPVPPYTMKFYLKRGIYRVLAFFKLVPKLHQSKKWKYEAID